LKTPESTERTHFSEEPTEWPRGLDVEVHGDDAIPHTGTVMTRMLTDRTGLTRELSGALSRSGMSKKDTPVH